MNFLAHLYLSKTFSPLMIGNFIGDYVKGKKYERYLPDVQKGILLHRKIDAFTDTHYLVKQSALRFKPCYQRYASVVTDVVYDHYLATLWNNYSEQSLSEFVDQVHSYLLKNYFSLPAHVKGFLPFLIKSRRLENYQYLWGIEKSLTIMANYSSLPDKSKCALKILEKEYDDLKMEFIDFFYELQQMVNAEMDVL
jgi:acyl carrier protein phosphodiesterase